MNRKVEISVLGPFTAGIEGTSVAPSATKPRQLLALLALYRDRVVTVSTMMEEIWGEAIPRSARTTLQTYIAQLRRHLGAGLRASSSHVPHDAKEWLVTRHDGYLLRMRPERLDCQEFDDLVDAGHRATAARDDRAASDFYRRALDLWKGPALVDVRVGDVLELERVRLEESRMAALERRIDADLRLGLSAPLVPELQVLVARYPLHENFCAQLMVALQRAGSSWRAMEAYQRLRSSLAGELGVEPSVRSQRIHQALLAGEEPPGYVPAIRADARAG